MGRSRKKNFSEKVCAMKFQFVTSMHKPYFDHIGQVMIESWLNYWGDEDCELVVYGENFSHDFDNKKVVWRDWNDLCKEKHNTYATKISGPAVKFAKKGFAFLDAMKTTTAERLIWADADLLFYKKPPVERFFDLLPENKLIAFFDQYYLNNPNYSVEEYTDKEKRKTYGAESGFVIVNPKHKDYRSYTTNYESLYTAEEMHDLMSIWYDTEVLVLAAREYLHEVVDLSTLRTTNKTQTPMNRSWISEFVNHQKAKSKDNYTQNDLRRLCGLVK